MSRNFIQRCCVGVLLFLITLTAILYSGPIFTALCMTISFFLLQEILSIFEKVEKGFDLTLLFGFGTALLLFTALGNDHLALATAFAFCTVLHLIFFIKKKIDIQALSLSLFAFAYVYIPLFMILAIYRTPIEGVLWVIYLLLVVKLSDTGAYIIGKLFGNRKLIPNISPNKTWEGFVGRVGFAVITGTIFWQLTNVFDSFALAVFVPLIMGVLAEIGDLSESHLKRAANVKDSSTLPGLGGFLDLFDSLVFTAPFLYILLRGGVL